MRRTCGVDKGGCSHGSKSSGNHIVSGPCAAAKACLERERENQHWRRKQGLEMQNGKPIKPKPYKGINHSVWTIIGGRVVDIGG